MAGAEAFMSVAEIREKLLSGELVTISNSSTRSAVWQRFHFVVNNETKGRIGYVICTEPTCRAIYAHRNAKSGTKNLLEHKCKTHFPNAEQHEEPFVEASVSAKNMILQGCVALCLKDRRPYMAVEGNGFEEFAQQCIDVGHKFGRVKASAVLPHRTTVSNNIRTCAESLRAKVLPELTDAMKEGFCAITTDGCTEDTSKEHFLTMTTQHLASVDGKWTLKPSVLFTNRFSKSGKYTAADVKDHLWNSCAARGFPSTLIEKLPFVTDGGSDIVKALSDCKRLYCFDHFFNVCLNNGFELKVYQLNLYTAEATALVENILGVVEGIKKKTVGRKFLGVIPKGRKRGPFPSKLPLLRLFRKEYDKIKMYCSDGLDHIDCLKIDELCQMLEPMEAILKTCKTAIPTSKFESLMNLLVPNESHSEFQQDLMRNFVQEFMSLEVLKYVSDCKALVTHFKHDVTLMKELDTTLKQSCETRWNSLYNTLETIRNQFEMVIQVLMDAEQYDWVMKINKEELLSSICTLLKPFKEESVLVQAAKSPTLHLCLPSLHFLKKHCQPDPKDASSVACVRARILSELNVKAQMTLEHKISTLLCPSFRQLKMLPSEEIKDVHDTVRKILKDISISKELAAAPTFTPTSSSSRYSDWLEDTNDELNSELERYLREPKGDDTDLLQWWQAREQSHPTLSVVARRVLVIPASSAASERVFSTLKLMLSNLRQRLDLESLDDMIFVEMNSKWFS